MAGVRVKEGETFESALKRFKRLCEQEKILSEIKKHQHYEKPSERRRKKLIAAKKKLFRQLRAQKG